MSKVVVTPSLDGMSRPAARPLDRTDVALIAALRRDPRQSVTQLARAVDIARGTAYSRLDRLEAEGVITGYGPDVDEVRAGFVVRAFTTLEISQGSHAATIAALGTIAEILETHTVTGGGDLLCRIVARSNDHLHDVLQRVVAITSVRRTETQLALSSTPRRTTADLLAGR
jgi:DNA-binding Lrp family transcriptional regulator